jgi:mannose/fructose-specific phosphotransferase system component IIA
MVAERAKEPMDAGILVSQADINPSPPNRIASSSLFEIVERVSVVAGMDSPMTVKMNLTMPVSSLRAAARV